MSVYKKKLCSVIIIALAGYFLVWGFASGFRWPSNYILTNHVITYIYGFIPRGLVGEIGSLIFGYKWYSWKYMSAVIMAVGAVFVIWMIYELVYNGYNFRNPVMVTLIMLFALSPYARYYLHEMGYFEQYGYAMLSVAAVFFLKKRRLDVYVIPCIIGFISLLVSESNAFLILPITFMLTLLSIINDSDSESVKDYIRPCAILVCSYIPHIIYTVVVWFIKVPNDLVIKLQDHDRDMVYYGFGGYNFVFREDVHPFLSGDRSNQSIWPRQLRPVPVWSVVMCLLVIVFVTYIIYTHKKDRKLAVSYAAGTILTGLGTYSILIVGWDLDRFYFCIFMSVFWVTVFIVKKYLTDLKMNVVDGFFICMFLLAGAGLGTNRLQLFDEAVYNEGWLEFLNMVRSKLG
ncbi:MAG: hypothetical protein J5966_08555 [Lachnospiraceae bacterium]|nr:hypothetical protein [Lachnospiraceae bacterium]